MVWQHLKNPALSNRFPASKNRIARLIRLMDIFYRSLPRGAIGSSTAKILDSNIPASPAWQGNPKQLLRSAVHWSLVTVNNGPILQRSGCTAALVPSVPGRTCAADGRHLSFHFHTQAPLEIISQPDGRDWIAFTACCRDHGWVYRCCFRSSNVLSISQDRNGIGYRRCGIGVDLSGTWPCANG